MKLTILRIVLPLVALAVFCWLFLFRPAKLTVDMARQLNERADAAFKAGRYAEAVTSLERLERQSPQDPIILGALAQSYGRLGRWKDAAERWERYLPVAPRPVEACPSLPKAYEAQGLNDKAFDAYDRCYRIEPTNPDLVYSLASACERRGLNDRALQLYEAGRKSEPKSADFALGLARVYLRLGRLDDANGILPTIGRDDADTLLVRAQLSIRREKFGEARGFLTQALSKNEAYVDLHVLMAVVERHDGNLDAARLHCDRALTLDPANQDARTMKATLRAGK